MLLKLTLCLTTLVLLADQTRACNRLHEACKPLLPFNCCTGLHCKRSGLTGGFRCEQGDGIFGRCYTRGELCTPDIFDNPCCDGLHCKPRLLNPTIHECE